MAFAFQVAKKSAGELLDIIAGNSPLAVFSFMGVMVSTADFFVLE